MAALPSLRNIGIIAHIDAGKTTLTERILFYTRKIHRLGEVHDGTAAMDFLPEEQERGITISSACTTCAWNDVVVNLIDTPGHVDFTIEVERSLRVLDGAVGVFCAVSGVEPQSETVWRQSERFGVPKLAFVNKMDRPGADFSAVLDALRARLHALPLPLNMPVGAADSFSGLIDLVRLERLDFDHATQGATVTRRVLTDAEQALAAPWRERMLETLADSDETFLDAYLAESFSLPDILAAIRRATLARRLTPVLAGSALRNIGVQPVLDAVADYLPSPLDIKPPLALDPESGECRPVPCDTQAPLLALVFKVLMDGGRKLAFLRLYAGTLREGDACRAVTRKENERVSRLYRLHADRREQLALASAGDIVAVIGLRHAHTGDTVSAPGEIRVLERITTYAPVISRALEPRNADEGKALDEALARFTTEDPTLTVDLDEGSGHRILSGMGELHLDVVLERMRREYAVAPRVGNPQVIRRETVARPGIADGLFERELGDQLHHGDLSLAVAPRERGAGNVIVFSPETENTALPRALRGAILQGVEDTLLSGPATGYPVQDVAVRITAVRRREGASTAPGFQMAAGLAVRQALEAARPLPLEPIMAVEISVPEDWLGSAIGLFGAHGGKVEALEERGGQKCVQGLAPLARLFGFSTELRSATQGRAGLMLRFARFDTA